MAYIIEEEKLQIPKNKKYRHFTSDINIFLKACNGIFQLSDKQMDIVAYMVKENKKVIDATLIADLAKHMNLSEGSIRNYFTGMRKKRVIEGKELNPVFTSPSQISVTYDA